MCTESIPRTFPFLITFFELIGGSIVTPTVLKMEVFPVAGKDSMEMNLSGAHAP